MAFSTPPFYHGLWVSQMKEFMPICSRHICIRSRRVECRHTSSFAHDRRIVQELVEKRFRSFAGSERDHHRLRYNRKFGQDHFRF